MKCETAKGADEIRRNSQEARTLLGGVAVGRSGEGRGGEGRGGEGRGGEGRGGGGGRAMGAPR